MRGSAITGLVFGSAWGTQAQQGSPQTPSNTSIAIRNGSGAPAPEIYSVQTARASAAASMSGQNSIPPQLTIVRSTPESIATQRAALEVRKATAGGKKSTRRGNSTTRTTSTTLKPSSSRATTSSKITCRPIEATTVYDTNGTTTTSMYPTSSCGRPSNGNGTAASSTASQGYAIGRPGNPVGNIYNGVRGKWW